MPRDHVVRPSMASSLHSPPDGTLLLMVGSCLVLRAAWQRWLFALVCEIILPMCVCPCVCLFFYWHAASTPACPPFARVVHSEAWTTPPQHYYRGQCYYCGQCCAWPPQARNHFGVMWRRSVSDGQHADSRRHAAVSLRHTTTYNLPLYPCRLFMRVCASE